MKVIIPVDEASPNTGVCPSFGRAPYFALCEGGSVEFIENPGAAAEGGAGRHGAGRHERKGSFSFGRLDSVP